MTLRKYHTLHLLGSTTQHLWISEGGHKTGKFVWKFTAFIRYFGISTQQLSWRLDCLQNQFMQNLVHGISESWSTSKANTTLFTFSEAGKTRKEVHHKHLNYISSNDVNCMIIAVYTPKVYIFLLFKCNSSAILSPC